MHAVDGPRRGRCYGAPGVTTGAIKMEKKNENQMATGGAKGGCCIIFDSELLKKRPLEEPNQPEEYFASLLLSPWPYLARCLDNV